MALSVETSHLLWAYDSFTSFAGGPDLPWVAEVYEELEDDVVFDMIQCLCYVWAVGQRAAGCYRGDIDSLADAVFDSLPGWDDSLPDDSKVAWLRHMGVEFVLPEPAPRPAAAQNRVADLTRWSSLDGVDRAAIEDMAEYFQIGVTETLLLYRLGLALKSATPAATVRLRLEIPKKLSKVLNGC